MAYDRWLGRLIVPALCAALVLGLARNAAADETELVFAGWGGTLGQALKSAVIPGFEKQHGVKVIYLTQETVNMVARLKAQAARPQVDVVAGTDASHSIGRRQGLFEKLDPAAFANFADLYPFAITADGVGVMFGIQALGLEYDTKVFQEKGWPAPSSWNDLWDPGTRATWSSTIRPMVTRSPFWACSPSSRAAPPRNSTRPGPGFPISFRMR